MPNSECWHIQVRGQVQGVGLRPFVYRLAHRLGLQGEVLNQSSGVSISVQGPASLLDQFVTALRQQAPGEPCDFSIETVTAADYDDFVINPSRADAGVATALLTDRAVCEDCLREFSDPGNRRYGYPFISCTHCGPRFSICERLPYDRENTSWHQFPMCGDCRREYESPSDRRFHAVGISCEQCGPSLFTANGKRGREALTEAVALLQRGGVLAVKGSAGVHLMVDAANPEAVARLRARKRRSKPLAVLAPDLSWAQDNATLDPAEVFALQGPAAPIVLLHTESELGELLAPGIGLLGVMLPNNGVHLALMQRLQRPLVATSANVSGAPLIYKNDSALQGLADIADGFLLHNLDLTQGLDDSVVRVMAARAVNLRLGRGLAPQIHQVPNANSSLGCGAHLKANLAFQDGHTLIVGPHVGDLDGAGTRQRYREQKRVLPAFFQIDAGVEVTDLHPDYGSTLDADYRASTASHHIAHAMAAWLEHQPEPPFLALTWDGIGLGPDGAVWGGECLQFDAGFVWQRLGSICHFRLPTGHTISRFPGKVGRALTGDPIPGRSVDCSSMGRLVEGLAALAGLRQENQFEAQVAMEWEALARRARHGAPMEFGLTGSDLDWRPLLPVIGDQSIDVGARALGFHQALARAAIRQCRLGRGQNVLLSGGVFQNRLLVELMLAQAQDTELQLLLPERVPPNDGGIALGQCVAVAMAVKQIGVIEQCA